MAEEGEAAIEAFVHAWNRAMMEKDVESTSRLRAPGYRLGLPGGGELDRREEIEIASSTDYVWSSVTLEKLSIECRAGEAVAVAENRVTGTFDGGRVDKLLRYTFLCREGPDGWVAHRTDVEELADFERPDTLPAAPRRRWSLGRLAAAARRVGAGKFRKSSGATFQALAFLPYQPGSDYVLPPMPPPAAEGSDLPVPPKNLWMGSHYNAHGRAHVRNMLEIAQASGLSFDPGDRILDLGCGSGRMIRHLRHLADRCEIWGTDISAPHILWCRHHLSPPFRFATTTKVPHLPFEDRSFKLIYCGSLFTHIDDLADAWLLELKRILAPGGRLYVTIHDEHTVALFDRLPYADAEIVRAMKSSRTFETAKRGFGMFTIGRDEQSQVFYRRDYFTRMVSASFDVLSVTDEAYHYQTAFLLGRKGGSAMPAKAGIPAGEKP